MTYGCEVWTLTSKIYKARSRRLKWVSVWSKVLGPTRRDRIQREDIRAELAWKAYCNTWRQRNWKGTDMSKGCRTVTIDSLTDCWTGNQPLPGFLVVLRSLDGQYQSDSGRQGKYTDCCGTQQDLGGETSRTGLWPTCNAVPARIGGLLSSLSRLSLYP